MAIILSSARVARCFVIVPLVVGAFIADASSLGARELLAATSNEIGFEPASFPVSTDSKHLASLLLATSLARAPTLAAASVPVVDFQGSTTGEREITLKVAKSGAHVVHRKVVAEQANMRLGTAVAKTRSEVRGGGRKPYQQKGTGRARRGSTRSPLLVGGGKSFGPRQKSYHIDMNKKEKQIAISTALMSATPRMTVLSDFTKEFSRPNTKDMREFLERLDVDTTGEKNCLMITKERHENTYLSARNIPYLNFMSLDNINCRDILRAKKILVSQSALDVLSDRYSA